ncbi:DNA cytosine methyltransferase [Aromatoleum toluclasticum]|uniref:DNA cytosine methyltransferase n=1 Tax=Aromatoleum toluclasticum TaxID=92003 RepID=UPI00037562CF|nr:DNA cytosine methyltransferase [Aromatoleum toluclasticum]
MIRDQFILDLQQELIVDNFAGGGGASCGIELALGRHVDIAINHDPEAVAMHHINHPQTQHHCESVWDVDPLQATQGRPVGLAWFSPDCKHFSKAKGGKPREKKIRGLAWIVQRWAALVRPRVIILENVEEFRTWGPLTADGHPCPVRKGQTFRSFIRQLQEKGYAVEHRELRACDYGAPTIRKRLFLIARCDGNPIVWPAPTHGAPSSPEVKAGHRKPWRTAAECIDWTIPCPSIFERRKPLAEATLRRIARGIRRYVIETAQPFIVGIDHRGSGDSAAWASSAPMTTVTSEARHALCVPTLVQTGYGERPGQAPRVPGLHKPLGTAVDGQKHALVTAFLAKHYGGNETPGWPLQSPISTLTTQDHHHLVTSNMVKLRGTSSAAGTDEPLHTVSAGGTHHAEVRAFLVKYYSEGGQDQDCRDPMHTIPTKDRLGLVTVAGEQYAIADIGMRMLEPHELYAAQGFPASYVFAPVINDRRLPKHAQVRMCGNSVSPPLAAALVRANVPEMIAYSRKEVRQMEKAA